MIGMTVSSCGRCPANPSRLSLGGSAADLSQSSLRGAGGGGAPRGKGNVADFIRQCPHFGQASVSSGPRNRSPSYLFFFVFVFFQNKIIVCLLLTTLAPPLYQRTHPLCGPESDKNCHG